jgi:uncharacterized RDD family membrane protein YckC
VARRLAAFTYEGVLLFGVVWVAGLVYGIATNQRHALAGSAGLQVTVFVVLGAYFVYFWSRHGQTLAMRTWRLRLVGSAGTPPGPGRACVRYLLAWLWFLPALAAVSMSGLKGGGEVAAVVVAGVLAYAALARLRGDGQFLHDVVCGTRIVDASVPPTPSSPAPVATPSGPTPTRS